MYYLEAEKAMKTARKHKKNALTQHDDDDT